MGLNKWLTLVDIWIVTEIINKIKHITDLFYT